MSGLEKNKILSSGHFRNVWQGTVCTTNEKTPFYPRSPYGVAKVYAHWVTGNYRETCQNFCL